MEKIGLIGGLGPEATVDYYKAIIDSFKEDNKGSFNYPEVIIYSVNLEHFIGMIKRGAYQEATAYLAEKMQALERAGAEMIALTANTPHLLYKDLQAAVKVPMISIVEATAREAKRLGIKRAGLIGTAFTMNAGFYQDVFNYFRIKIETPDEKDKAYIHQKLFSELGLGIFKDETREGLIEIIKKMKTSHGIEGIILGCTEFPLILPLAQYHDIPALNTTLIHVKEIVEWSKTGSLPI
jgi:aspartate racemase